VDGQFYALAQSTPGEEKQGWVGPGLVWAGVEKRKFLAPTGVQKPNHPAHNELLYQLCYPNHLTSNTLYTK